MATHVQPITEAEILAALIAPDRPSWPPELARLVLDLQFTADQVERMSVLAQRNNAGELTEQEHNELESYLHVGNFLSLAHSKARLSIKQSDA
jgi:hypothetical protein